jgi:hypothetical protein
MKPLETAAFVRARAAEDALRHRDALSSAVELERLAADAARLAGALRSRIAAAPQSASQASRRPLRPCRGLRAALGTGSICADPHISAARERLAVAGPEMRVE